MSFFGSSPVTCFRFQFNFGSISLKIGTVFRFDFLCPERSCVSTQSEGVDPGPGHVKLQSDLFADEVREIVFACPADGMIQSVPLNRPRFRVRESGGRFPVAGQDLRADRALRPGCGVQIRLRMTDDERFRDYATGASVRIRFRAMRSDLVSRWREPLRQYRSESVEIGIVRSVQRGVVDVDGVNYTTSGFGWEQAMAM